MKNNNNKVITLLIGTLFVLMSGTVSAASRQITQQQWQGAVVYSAFGTMGSGVPVSRCHVLTNEHVVRGGGAAKVALQGSGSLYRAEAVATDKANDLVLLKVSGCPVKDYATLSPVAPRKGEILTSVYYKPGFNFFRKMIRTQGRFLGVQSVVTEEDRQMTSLAIDDPHPYLRASGGGVASQHGLVSVIFGVAQGRLKRKTYAVSYRSLKKFLQQHHLYSSDR